MDTMVRLGLRGLGLVGLAFGSLALSGCNEGHRQPYERHEVYRSPGYYQDRHEGRWEGRRHDEHRWHHDRGAYCRRPGPYRY